jgi:flavodoxin
MYGNYANTSDKGVQVTVDNVTYSSASEYWSQKQADYVYSGDYFKKKEQEMDDTTNKLKALTEFGVVPFSRFSDMDKEFDKMTTNKALSNYVNDIEVMRLRKKRDLAMNIADTVYAEFQTRLDIAEARYGKNSKQVTAIYNEYKNFRSQLTNSSGVQITGLPSFDEYEAGKSILDTVTKPKSTPAPTTADVPDTLSPKTVTTPPPYTPPELSEIKNTLTPNKETTTPPPSVTPPSINNKPNQPAQPVYTPPPPVTAPIPTTPPPSNSGGGSNIPYLTWLTPQPVTTPTPTPTPPPSNSGGGSWINSSSSSTPAPSTPAPSNPQARADQMESRGYPKK